MFARAGFLFSPYLSAVVRRQDQTFDAHDPALFFADEADGVKMFLRAVLHLAPALAAVVREQDGATRADRPRSFAFNAQAVERGIDRAANRQPFLPAVFGSQYRSITTHGQTTPFVDEGHGVKRITLRTRILPLPPSLLLFAGVSG